MLFSHSEDTKVEYPFTEKKEYQQTEICSIYDFYIRRYLKKLCQLPLENQLVECIGYRILVLDFCGMIVKLQRFFSECDVYIVNGTDQNIEALCKSYDVVYVLVYQLQCIYLEYPAIKLVFSKNILVESVVN